MGNTMDEYIKQLMEQYGEDSVICTPLEYIRDNIPAENQKEWLLEKRKENMYSSYYYLAITKCLDFLEGRV